MTLRSSREFFRSRRILGSYSTQIITLVIFRNRKLISQYFSKFKAILFETRAVEYRDHWMSSRVRDNFANIPRRITSPVGPWKSQLVDRPRKWNRYVTGRPRTHTSNRTCTALRTNAAPTAATLHPHTHPVLHQHVLRGYYVLWCGAIKPGTTSTAPVPPHHRCSVGTDVRTRGASLCLLLPHTPHPPAPVPPAVYPFVHSSERTHTLTSLTGQRGPESGRFRSAL